VLAFTAFGAAALFGRYMAAAQFLKPVHRHYCSGIAKFAAPKGISSPLTI
jgi:hypothetical protein